MIKDKILRLLFIPLLGILIPFFFRDYYLFKVLGTGTYRYQLVLYFAFVLHLVRRRLDPPQASFYI